MTTRAEIVAEARGWIGTRWSHQHSMRGVGCDCIGLVRGVGIETGLVQRDWQNMPGVRELLGYGREPHGATLEKVCAMYLNRIDESIAMPGDVVLMQYHGEARHMGILGDYVHGGLSLIHSYLPARKVIETRLDDRLRAHVVSWHRFPGVDA